MLAACPQFQATEKWFFFPGGYFNLAVTSEGLLVCFLGNQSPEQSSRIANMSIENQKLGGRMKRIVGEALGPAAEKLGDWSKSKTTASCLPQLEQMQSLDVPTALALKQQNYLISLASIQQLDFETSADGDEDWLTVHLADGSGPWLRRAKRVFLLEPLIDPQPGPVIEAVKQVYPGLVRHRHEGQVMS